MPGFFPFAPQEVLPSLWLYWSNDVPLKKTHPSASVSFALLELARRDDWLLIFDNAVDPRDILPYIPASGGGHILVTSRNPAWAGLGGLLEVDVFSRWESIALLCGRLGRVTEPVAEKLARELGDLALALEQAAAYMQETNLPPESYLHFLVENRDRLMDRGMPVLYGRTVSVTFGLAHEKIAAESPAAAKLLELCAFLEPDSIPVSLFTRDPNLLPRELAVVARDELLFNDIIGIIRRYSLMATGGTHFSLSKGFFLPSRDLRIHRLVQIAIANKLNSIDKEARLRCVLALINSAIGKDYTMPGHTTEYESQALSVMQNPSLAGR